MRSTDPSDLNLVAAVRMLRERSLSATELVDACLRRVQEVDGERSFEGSPTSVNAWARVYEEDARLAAKRCDELLSARRQGSAPPLCGIPFALKDVFAVAGKPLTASSLVLNEVPTRNCDVWARLECAGAILLGHVHTHEFAAGCTTDQVGNPWDLSRSVGGSSGGSAAALAARMVPAAMGTDTGGSLRIPSALCGTSAIKPTRGLVSLAGVVPLAGSLDHVGPMARTVADCAMLLHEMAGPDRRDASTAFASLYTGGRLTPSADVKFTVAISPRISQIELDADVEDGFDAALAASRTLGWSLIAPADSPPADLDGALWRLQGSEIVAYHEQFKTVTDRYRSSTRQLVEAGRREDVTTQEYFSLQSARRRDTESWSDWFSAREIDAIIEPTVPTVAPKRGNGYFEPEAHVDLLSLTHLWNWTGFPVVALPVGVGARSGLPVGVSLVGRPGMDAELLQAGAELQDRLGATLSPDLQALSMGCQ